MYKSNWLINWSGLEKIDPEKCTNQQLNDVFGSISAFFEDFPLIEVIIADRCFLSENIV